MIRSVIHIVYYTQGQSPPCGQKSPGRLPGDNCICIFILIGFASTWPCIRWQLFVMHYKSSASNSQELSCFNIQSLSVSLSAISNTWPDPHFFQYIMAYGLSSDLVPSRMNQYHPILTSTTSATKYRPVSQYTDPVPAITGTALN